LGELFYCVVQSFWVIKLAVDSEQIAVRPLAKHNFHTHFLKGIHVGSLLDSVRNIGKFGVVNLNDAKTLAVVDPMV
jgi:hypothetical protein